MAIYAVVEKGVVTNIVEWDGQSAWKPDAGDVIHPGVPVSPGWLYDGHNFTAPESDGIPPL